MKYSIVVPVYNEEQNVSALFHEIKEVMDKLGHHEIIFVDDGSSDRTVGELEKLSGVKVVKLNKNYGQSTALKAGLDTAKGEIIITMDGDGQNDPKDIPLLLEELGKGFDAVSGWRFNRKDKASKKILSRFANKLRLWITGEKIHDSGCSLKAYKRHCFDDFYLNGEMHRYITATLMWKGYKIGEVKVNHRPRTKGKTKYNWQRLAKGFLDLIVVFFWQKYSSRPIHLLGGIGALSVLAGFALGVLLFIERVFFGISMSEKIWPLIAVFLILAGIQMFVSGILADISIKNYYSAPGRKKYVVEKVIER